jgi:hypothetical protein
MKSRRVLMHSTLWILLAELLLASATLSAAQASGASRLLIRELPDAPHAAIVNFRRTHYSFSPPMAVQSSISATDLRLLEGHRIKISLLSDISSKMERGHGFEARLSEPLRQEGKLIFPAETRINGHIETLHARRMMRRGAMYLAFDTINFPDGRTVPVHAYVVSVDSPKLKRDAEGRLEPVITHRRMAIELGGTALTAKFADDLSEALASGTVSAARARYVGLGASTLFLLVQKGPEAKLKAGDKLEIEIGRQSPVEH